MNNKKHNETHDILCHVILDEQTFAETHRSEAQQTRKNYDSRYEPAMIFVLTLQEVAVHALDKIITDEERIDSQTGARIERTITIAYAMRLNLLVSNVLTTVIGFFGFFFCE